MVRAGRAVGRTKREHIGTFIGKYTRLFATILDYKVGVDIYPEIEGRDDVPGLAELGIDVFLRVSSPRAGRVRINLTRMTRAELDLFADMVDMAIDLARPVTTARDLNVQEADDDEDNEHILRRLFARVPVLLAKEGPISRDVPKLPLRYEGDGPVGGYLIRRTTFKPPADAADVRGVDGEREK